MSKIFYLKLSGATLVFTQDLIHSQKLTSEEFELVKRMARFTETELHDIGPLAITDENLKANAEQSPMPSLIQYKSSVGSYFILAGAPRPSRYMMMQPQEAKFVESVMLNLGIKTEHKELINAQDS